MISRVQRHCHVFLYSRVEAMLPASKCSMQGCPSHQRIHESWSNGLLKQGPGARTGAQAVGGLRVGGKSVCQGGLCRRPQPALVPVVQAARAHHHLPLLQSRLCIPVLCFCKSLLSSVLKSFTSGNVMPVNQSCMEPCHRQSVRAHRMFWHKTHRAMQVCCKGQYAMPCLAFTIAVSPVPG